MTDSRLDDLLQRHLDGELTREDVERLQHELASSPEARQRAAELASLHALIGELADADPPPALVTGVMSAVSQAPRPKTDSSAHGRTFGRAAATPAARRWLSVPTSRPARIMWSVATAAAVVFGVFAIAGYPPVDRGTEGAIGAANGSDPEGDAIQEFLQSAEFDRLLKDDGARRLLSEPELRSRLAQADVHTALTSAELRNLLDSQAARRALSRPEVVAFLSRSGAPSSTVDERVREALGIPEIAAASSSAAFRRLLEDPVILRIVTTPDLQDGLRGDAMRTALAHPDFRAAIDSPEVGAALASPR